MHRYTIPKAKGENSIVFPILRIVTKSVPSSVPTRNVLSSSGLKEIALPLSKYVSVVYKRSFLVTITNPLTIL